MTFRSDIAWYGRRPSLTPEQVQQARYVVETRRHLLNEEKRIREIRRMLPSVRDLARRWDVNFCTVHNAVRPGKVKRYARLAAD